MGYMPFAIVPWHAHMAAPANAAHPVEFPSADYEVGHRWGCAWERSLTCFCSVPHDGVDQQGGCNRTRAECPARPLSVVQLDNGSDRACADPDADHLAESEAGEQRRDRGPGS